VILLVHWESQMSGDSFCISAGYKDFRLRILVLCQHFLDEQIYGSDAAPIDTRLDGGFRATSNCFWRRLVAMHERSG